MAQPSQSSAAAPLPRPNAAEVRAHLDALLHNEALAVSDRNRRFLSYIVEETLAGRGDRIKAYNVAVTAFDRTDDFDPQTDPIVRIEASRLRRALEHYYLTAGKADALRIEVPKGSYVATFRYAERGPMPDGEKPVPDRAVLPPVARRRLPPMSKPPLWWIASMAATLLVVLAWILPAFIDRAVNHALIAPTSPSILILPFETGSSENQAFIAHGITAELIGRLAPFGQAPVTSDPAIQPAYVLSGSTHAAGTKIYISAVLADSRTGRYLWSWNVERVLSVDVVGTEAAIASEIVDGIKPVMRAQSQ